MLEKCCLPVFKSDSLLWLNLFCFSDSLGGAQEQNLRFIFFFVLHPSINVLQAYSYKRLLAGTINILCSSSTHWTYLLWWSPNSHTCKRSAFLESMQTNEKPWLDKAKQKEGLCIMQDKTSRFGSSESIYNNVIRTQPRSFYMVLSVSSHRIYTVSLGLLLINFLLFFFGWSLGLLFVWSQNWLKREYV